MQDLEILIRYKCEKCGGDGAKRSPDVSDSEGINRGGKVIGNCNACSGNGRHQKWVLAKDVPTKWIPI